MAYIKLGSAYADNTFTYALWSCARCKTYFQSSSSHRSCCGEDGKAAIGNCDTHDVVLSAVAVAYRELQCNDFLHFRNVFLANHKAVVDIVLREAGVKLRGRYKDFNVDTAVATVLSISCVAARTYSVYRCLEG
jgi:hypothetical protein